MERNRGKPTEHLQLSLLSALLTGGKTPEGPKLENFKSAVNRHKCEKETRKAIGPVRTEKHLQEKMVLATAYSASLCASS